MLVLLLLQRKTRVEINRKVKGEEQFKKMVEKTKRKLEKGKNTASLRRKTSSSNKGLRYLHDMMTSAHLLAWQRANSFRLSFNNLSNFRVASPTTTSYEDDDEVT